MRVSVREPPFFGNVTREVEESEHTALVVLPDVVPLVVPEVVPLVVPEVVPDVVPLVVPVVVPEVVPLVVPLVVPVVVPLRAATVTLGTASGSILLLKVMSPDPVTSMRVVLPLPKIPAPTN